MRRTFSYSSRLQGQLIEVLLTGAALVVAGILLAVYAYLAVDWQSKPFIGFLPMRNLEVYDADSLTGADWPALKAGLKPGDQVVGLNGQDLDNVSAEHRIDRFYSILDTRKANDRILVRFLRESKPENLPEKACITRPDMDGIYDCLVSFRLRTVPTGDLISYFGVGWLAGLILWLLVGILFLRRYEQPAVRRVALFSSPLVVLMAGAFDVYSTHNLTGLWLLSGGLTGGLIVLFAMEFPYRYAAVQQNPLLGWAPLIVALAESATAIALSRATDTGLNNAAYYMTYLMPLLGLIMLVASMLWWRSRSASPVSRNQSTMVLLGTGPWLASLLIWFGWLVVRGENSFSLLLFIQMLSVLLPISAIYAVSQLRPLDTDRVITGSVLYGALLALLVVSYWLIVTGIALLVGRTTRDTALSPVLIALSIFVVAILFEPLRVFLQRLIDSVYFRARRTYQVYLEQFSREVTNAVTLGEVISLLERYLGNALNPTHVILYVRELATGDYRPQPDPKTDHRLTDITFMSESGLVRYLRDRASLLYLEEGRPLPLDVVSDRARLAVLGAPVIVRLKGQKVLNGFLVVGPRQGGAAYLHEDLRFIDSLSDQIALAVERAQAIGDLERRVRVQDVLSQVSRALNFAIDFDTLLELIYAQTSRVIDAPNFYIALRNPNIDELSYVFYNEGDERDEAMEGKRWRLGRDLMSEIVRTQQTLRTDDYVRETLTRDARAQIDNPNLKSWLGVPLLTDTGSSGGALGVMVAATTEPGKTFSDDQQDLFWDIANLAASAIGKLQLFDKTQQRARQLSVINQISSQLASELGNVDRLLRLITENAVSILNAEAGSLLLVDEESSDLIFHVVVGGSGENLVGTRIPAGVGLAGATVQRGTSIIVNDPSRDSRWHGEMTAPDDAAASGGNGHTADSGGFQSNAILSVPLLVQGHAIGVLQTINKRDGSIFIREDADLLETFAGQAAIAIENARLFDMTDQQLALRVQELDTMQRIDQELNRTLNLANVVDITMDWALRKSGATAGALFILDREINELRQVQSYGYPPTSPFTASDENLYPTDRGVVGRVIRTGHPSLITDVSIDPDYDETLPGCVAQLVVPLFSANQVIGVIILESDHEAELDLLDLDFVARLAEHASPAIVNAQLFQELEKANQDKSRFVSMVAHELKNPMTSMKGYTDLLLKGVVGPVNEQQGDFLKTVLNNVNRMETLVSDLNDLTKQETGNMRLEIFPVDFRNVVLETLRSIQGQIEEKGQLLDVNVPDSMPLVMGDQNRLIQILTNFLSNAYKYTPTGGIIEIKAEATRNTWDQQGAQQVIHCFVRDTGIGMSDEDLKKLFTPYFRSENYKAREQPGTGLGMTITRGLIEQHGGKVWVESVLDEGTTFHFTLPVALETAAQPRVRA